MFPHVLVRLSGGSFEFLQDLDREPLDEQQLYAAECDLDKLRANLCETLFQQIQTLENNDQLRRQLLNIKRDLFNGRRLGQTRQTLLSQILPQESAALQAVLKQCDQLTETSRAAFSKQLEEVREVFKERVRDQVLAKGLVLSSKSLESGRLTYLKAKKIGKREAKTETALLKYLTRICAKTSPFSTFTNLSIATVEATRHPLLPNESRPVVTAAIRLNNILFEYLHDLMALHPAYIAFFRVRPNPTLQRGDDHYLFLVNSRNIESFQRLPVDPVLDLLLDQTAAHPAGMTHAKLIQTLGDFIEARPQELEAYIGQLINYGFFELDLGISCIDTDWDLKLKTTLTDMTPTPPFARQLTQVLSRLRDLSQTFADADADARPKLLQTGFDLFQEVCRHIHRDAGLPDSAWEPPAESTGEKAEEKEAAAETAESFQRFNSTHFIFKPEQMFYEDCTVDSPAQINEDGAQQITDAFVKLLALALRPGGFHRERVRMCAYFRQNFGDHTDLLSFYEAYYRDVRLQEKPPSFEEVAAFDRQADAYGQKLKAIIAGRHTSQNGHVHLEPKWFEESDLLDGFTPPKGSFAAFLQPYLDDQGRPCAVINQISMGYGRMFSRFLHLFDEAVTNDLRRDNLAQFPDTFLTEACDASVFNANLHPPLLPYEIKAPGSWNNLPPDRQIPITDILVRPEGDRLIAFHAHQGKPIQVLNLGFQSDSGRSELFQLLQYLGPAEYRSSGPLLEVVNQSLAAATNSERPRIIWDNRLVLQRKHRHFPREDLPMRPGSESLWAYRRRLLDWQRQHQLPPHFFVRVTDHSERRTEEAKAGRDDYKPQYISLHNPLTPRLFDRLTARVDKSLTLTEMLPAPNQLLQFGPNHHTCETLFQITL